TRRAAPAIGLSGFHAWAGRAAAPASTTRASVPAQILAVFRIPLIPAISTPYVTMTYGVATASRKSTAAKRCGSRIDAVDDLRRPQVLVRIHAEVIARLDLLLDLV